MKRLAACLFALTATATWGQGTEVFVEATEKFLGALAPEQTAKAQYDFNDDERQNWHYFPKVRGGVNFHDLSADNQGAILELLRAILSHEGYEKVEEIRGLEAVLWELQGQQGTRRDVGDYYVAVFGTPGPESPWGLRYEGHHLSLNWTFRDGKVISSTPQFLGANPARVPSGPQEGFRALEAVEDMARRLVQSLSDEQRGQAILSAEAPPEILTGADRVASIQENRGIKYSALTEEQRELLMAILAEYAEIHLPFVAQQRIEKVKANLDDVTFAWMGGTEPGEGHYYRVQGQEFLVEYDNTQNNANHIHTVWREFDGDFGRDVLQAHYENAGPEHGHGINLAARHPMRAWQAAPNSN